MVKSKRIRNRDVKASQRTKYIKNCNNNNRDGLERFETKKKKNIKNLRYYTAEQRQNGWNDFYCHLLVSSDSNPKVEFILDSHFQWNLKLCERNSMKKAKWWCNRGREREKDKLKKRARNYKKKSTQPP